MEILTAIIATIIKYTVEPVSRQVGYIIHYKSNPENLRSQLKKLDLAKERRKHTVKEDERKGKRIHTDIQDWQKVADEMIEEANTIFEKEGRANTKCFRGVCPNLISNHQLSRKSAKLARKIELHHDQKEFPIVSYNAPLEEICATPSQNYIAFESRISMVKEIMEELNNPDTNLIGVYGLGGVGKSTLAKEVYRQATKEELFDDVVIVLDAKQFPELERNERIQQKIAEKLGMEVQGSKDVHIWNRIKDKKSLIILDDVWEAIDLEVLGLRPMATCKILFTSRVRVSEMRTQKEFWLDVLGEKESWVLFEKMVGDVVKDGPIKKVATQVAQKCGGLPVLVVTVASALRLNSSLEVWKDTLRRFKRFDDKELTEKARLAIEWSYNRLDAEELQPLFLLCGIIAVGERSIPLSDLLKYAMGLGLIKNVDTVEEARNALHSLAKKLKDSCLLLDSYDNRKVRMHELVRDVAIWIASKDKHAFSRAYGDEVKEWPDRDYLKKCTAISLKSCKIPRLPEEPWVCPELRFFVLGSDNVDEYSFEIPGNYFKGMNELKVLDVTGLRIPSLPPSLQSLTNLQTLCLDQCVLGDIALVGQLTNLKILSLGYSQVKELPKEIGQLTRLQLLDLTCCSELVVIPAGVISSLTSLEDLRMGSFEEWEGGLIDGRSNASVSELKQLRQLTALQIHIPDAKLLPANMFSDTKLERYTILIGDNWLYPRIYETSSNMLKLKLTTNSQFDQGIKLLLGRCEHLYLDGVEAANIISYILASDDGEQLKDLHVQNDDEVTSLINSSHAFPILESLSLDNLANLETVCCGQLIAQPFQKLRSLTLRNLPKLIGFSSKGSRPVVNTEAEEIISENEIGGPTKLFMNGEIMMPNLTSLVVHGCSGLRFLFSFSMARSLVQLTHLQIASCQIMKEIVTKIVSSEENTDNIFRKLKHLQLQHLPSLTRFCSGSYVEFPSLELLHLEDCSELGVFIFHSKSENVTTGKQTEERDMKNYIEIDVQYFLLDEKVGFPSLESLIIHDMPKLRTIWHRQLGIDSFRKLKIVEVWRCDTLINIFGPSMMGRLNDLHTLWINQCKSLQLVFDVGVVLGVKEAYGTSRTQLKTFGCPNLDCVLMDSCNSLKNIFPASVAKGLQQLRKLIVVKCGILEEIVAKEGVETTPTEEFVFQNVTFVQFRRLPQLRSFYPVYYTQVLMPNLTRLILNQCDCLRFLFLSSMAKSLEQLEYIEISKCQMMEEIVSTSGNNQEHTNNMFCNLKYLKLQHLPSLTRFCSGSYIEFSLLETLHIEDCPRLGTFIFDRKSEITSMGKENDDRNSKENLETVIPHFLFDEKVGFPSLERLIIYDLPALMTVWHNQLAQDSFCRLKEVNVYRCHNLINIFARSMMGRLNALYRLEIWQCQLLQVVFELGGVFEAYDTSTTQLKTFECPNLDFVEIDACERLINIFSASVAKGLEQLTKLRVENCGLMEINVKEKGSGVTPKFVFPKVTVVKFENLPQLRMFYPGMHVSEWPLLKVLAMTACDNVEIFASEISRFQKKLELGLQCTPIKHPFFLVDKVLMPNLTSLVVRGCGGLRFLFSSSMTRSLVQLKNLTISRCQIMEEIVTTNESSEEDADHNMLSQLQDLKLQYLPNLTRFCSARRFINLHSLEILHLEDCSKFETFIFDPMSANITINQANEEIGTNGQYFLFDEKVGFPSLQRLIIRDLPVLRTIWHDILAPNSFRKLKIVEVLRCYSLINIFAPSMMGRLNALHSLVIKQCKSLQVIFDVGVVLGVKEVYGTSRTQLKTFGCPNLDLVIMDSCESLKTIFPASVAKALQQLRELNVWKCVILEEIVANDGVETTPEFVFPKVTSMIFQYLPQLRSFYPEMHVSKWPLLKSLRFFECGKVEIFASEYSRFHERLYSGTPIKQPFLLVDKGNSFPNLEELYLDKNMKIWYEAHGPLPVELFLKLKRIRFSCAHPNSFAFVQKLRGLKELVVIGGPWKEIFVYEGISSGEIDAVGRTLPHIYAVGMHLGNDNFESIFPNLEILKVYRCARLKNLTSSAISFWNLTTLDIWHCVGLKYLITYSVAKCLQQLKNLEVKCCESMIEIVASNGDEQDSRNCYEIAFSSLQHLKLCDLPILRGFCSSEIFTIRVPSLNSLIVDKCLIELKISPDKSLIQSSSRPERQQITEEVEENETEEEDGNKIGGKQLIAHTS